jgi:hypothetical protein
MERAAALQTTKENVTPAMLNETTYNDLLLKEAAPKLNPDVLSEAVADDSKLEAPIRELLDQIESYSMNEKLQKSIDRSKAIVEDIQNIIANNPKAIQILDSNEIVTNLPNVQAMAEMLKQPAFIGKSLNTIAEKLKEDTLTQSVPKSPVEYVGDDDNLKETLNSISDKLNDVFFDEDTSTSLLREVKLLQNALRVQSFTSLSRETYSIPIRLHEKVTNLNMFVPKGKLPLDGHFTAVFSIDTPKYGTFDAYIRVADKELHVYMNNEDPEILQRIKGTRSELSAIFASAGFTLESVMYKDELDDKFNDDMGDMPQEITGEEVYNAAPSGGKNTKKQMFRLATCISKYLDTL